ncbi:MAG: PPC domain-containing protein, partial [Bacteroidota bacterium]
MQKHLQHMLFRMEFSLFLNIIAYASLKNIKPCIYLLCFCPFVLLGQDQFEPNNEFNNATSIDCNTFLDASIHVEGDQDWYRFQAPTTGYYNVRITNVPGNVDIDVGIFQENAGLTENIAFDNDNNSSGGQDVFVTAYLSVGTYYVRVVDENDNNANASETYRLSINCLPSIYEVNHTFEDAITIDKDGCFEERIYGQNLNFATSTDNSIDKDWFVISIDEPGYLTIEITAVPGNLDLNIDIYQLTNGQPERISFDQDNNAAGGQSMVNTAVVDNGLYYVLVNDENSNATNEETYFFCSSFIPSSRELNQNISTATSIATIGCFEERIFGQNALFNTSSNADNENDRDWYKVEITQSGYFSVNVSQVPGNLDLDVGIYTLENTQPVSVADDNDNT